MRKEKIIAFGCLIFIVFILGCTGGGETEVNETKLEENEGLGIVGSLKIDELNPGLDGYVSFTVRNNAGGENARDIYVGLDNVKPFKIVECGNAQDPSEKRTDSDEDCRGQYNLDSNLPFRLHGVTKMFPGEELDFYWRLRAPSADEISEIALKHPIYYDLEYSYKTSLTQNIIFMSQKEVLRRRQSGEEYEITGEARNSAGELRINGITQQPILYFFSDGVQSDFAFSLQYHIENIGEGIPLSDVVILFEIPDDDGIAVNKDQMKDYGWYEWKDWDGRIEFRTSGDTAPYPNFCEESDSKVYRCYCRTGKTDTQNPGAEELKNCTSWIEDTYIKSEFDDRFETAIEDDRLLVKVVKREDFVDSFDINVPLKIRGGKVQELKDANIPLQLSTFKVHSMYRYFTEGKEYITVYPIKI